jgi:hypothetical protein
LQTAEIAAEARCSTPGLSEPWDTPFNRATNAIKKRPKNKKIMSAGHVSGFGLSMKVGIHFKEDSKTRKERRSKVEEMQRLEIADLKAQIAALLVQMEEKFEARLRRVIPPQLW